jgi:ubiquinone/menaquinone biosynthesis C-methylase UbiE
MRWGRRTLQRQGSKTFFKNEESGENREHVMSEQDVDFSGSIPVNYDRYLGPMFFQPYAEDLAQRLQVRPDGSVLELACGTGILTRVLRSRLAPTVKLMATDLNEPMLRNAIGKFHVGELVQWQEVDATKLPFADATYDAVVCQFGLMFVPDKRAAVRETYRVLKPGGSFLFNVWDAMEDNELAKIAHETIVSFFDRDPPNFYEVPFGYHDRGEIEKLMTQEGFRAIQISVVAKESKASQAENAARGLVEGNPVVVAITERDPSLVPKITDAVAAAIKSRFGDVSVRAPMRAIIVQAHR